MPENHVFISYAHIDNEPISKERWVSEFHNALEILVKQKAYKHATVWRDPRMKRNAKFEQEIFEQLFQSLTLVSVVSPNYIQSKYCLEELNKFCENTAPIGTNSRVFKVVKTPVPLEEMPKIFQQINGFDFFKIDEETKKPREFIPEFGEEFKQQFWLKVSDLAYEIADLLKLINKSRLQPVIPAPDTLKFETVSKLATVFLAKTSSNFQIEHDNIRRDLLDRGYQVLPASDAVEPKTTEEYKSFVRENLQKCGLAVHLIGKNYGERPEDGDQSYIHLQSIVAAERDRNPNFKRIIWVPKDVNTNTPHHKDFVDEIWASTANGVEVLEKPLEELKTNILDALNSPTKTQPKQKIKTAKPSVLVLYDKTDAESAADVETYIKERGFSVWTAKNYLSAEPSKLIEAQNEYLRHCDSVLVYWKDSPDFWARISLQRLQKILGDGREVMFLGEAIFVDGDKNLEEIADDTETEFLNSFEELDAFLEEVKDSFQTRFEKGEQR